MAEDEERLIEEFRRQLDLGLWAAVPTAAHARRPEAVMIRDFAEVPRDAEQVVFYPPAAGGQACTGSSGGRESCCVPRLPRRSSPPTSGSGSSASPVAATPPARLLVYPHRPLVAYETLTGELLSEYCVRFRDDSVRLPDADDVLAKWLALRGRERERELIATANVNHPGHQVDPDHVRRDLALLARWRSERAVDSRAIDEPQRRQG